MAGFNRPRSQPPRRRGLFGNRSDTRQPVRRVASSAPTRAAVSYTSGQSRAGGGSVLRSISDALTRLVGIVAVVALIVLAVFGARIVLSLGDAGTSPSPKIGRAHV